MTDLRPLVFGNTRTEFDDGLAADAIEAVVKGVAPDYAVAYATPLEPESGVPPEMVDGVVTKRFSAVAFDRK